MDTQYIPKYGFSINEACKALGIGRTKIYEEIKSGRLKALKYGNRTLISNEALKDWISELPSMRETP